jgi:malonyl-CoA/methylmalonyl-CoA synthetase
MGLELFDRAAAHGERLAIVDNGGRHTYSDLLAASGRAASALLNGANDLNGARVAFMVEPSFGYLRTQWGIWRAGGIATPLCLTFPSEELARVLDNSRPTSVIVDAKFEDVIRPLAQARGLQLLRLDDLDVDTQTLPEIAEDRPAMMLYTSGTTGQPKGVVTTHRNIYAQIRSLVEAWEWTADDHTILTLPLHHLHGILNIVSCALWSGASCEMFPRFDAGLIWDTIESGRVSVFMAVPTIYHRLIEEWEGNEPDRRAELSQRCQDLRLMVSGSAALPVPVLERWLEISGHTLLERYGMTEIGMALSNPLHGERRPGFVGSPLPGVEVRLAPEDDVLADEGDPMEIQVRGDTVFREYWNHLDETKRSFTVDGWFKTGDIAEQHGDRYRILGRSSVDILKSGGEKISALEIENVLTAHPSVRECAVVGVPDPSWGQRVVAAIVPTADSLVEPGILKDWCKQRLAPHKVPKDFVLVEALPRNAMGKVTKQQVVSMVGP